MEFLKVDTLENARQKLLTAAGEFLPQTHWLSLEKAHGQILAQDIIAKENVPNFRRSTVDGYACLSKDTAAAGEGIPAFLTLTGSVEMGEEATLPLNSGECIEVPTGAMLPDGADGVAMVEYCEVFGDQVAIYKSISHGENLVQVGEDIQLGTPLLAKGKKLCASDIGALCATGITKVNVYTPPKITIISTGDELVPPNHKTPPGKVRDINTYTLSELSKEKGFEVIELIILKDQKQLLEEVLQNSMKTSDIVVISGGSSQGEKDLTAKTIDKVSSPGVFTHGLAIKPGKPTIFGCDQTSNTLFVGLPGHPVAAMVVFELILARLYQTLTKAPKKMPIPANLSTNAPAADGKLTVYPCALELGKEGYIATPLFGKSGLITTLTNAHGYFIIDRDVEGLKKGETVWVHSF